MSITRKHNVQREGEALLGQTAPGWRCLVRLVVLLILGWAGEGSSLAEESLLSLRRVQESISLRAVILQQPKRYDHVRDLLAGFDSGQTLSLQLSSSWLGGRLKGEAEIADSSPSASGIASDTRGWRYRLMRFGFTGSEGPFRYGAMYRAAGSQAMGIRDQMMREVWGEWSYGMIRLRTALTEYWDNLDRDPGRARWTGIQEKTTLAIGRPSWPELGLSYVKGTISSSLEPVGMMPVRSRSDTVEATLSYATANWNARVLSAYSLVSDRLRPDGESRAITYMVQAAYRPTRMVTISPSLSFRKDQQQWSGVQIQTPSASLALTYSPWGAFNVTTLGAYSQTHSSDGLIDSSTYRVKSVFTWTELDSGQFQTTFSIDAGYTTSLDAVQPARSMEELSGLVRIEVARR